MKAVCIASVLAMTAVLALLGATSAPANAQESPVVTVPPGMTEADAALAAVARAPNPSAAVEAYAAGARAAPHSVPLRQAFMQRMIALGVPQMAESQAQDLAQGNPQNGLAWAVLAYAHAARGATTEALQDIVSAVKNTPDEVFVQRTAGQLLAWYDTMADWSQVPVALQSALDQVRTRLTDNPAYARAYQAARSEYELENDTGLPSTPNPLPPGSYAERTPPVIPEYNYYYDYTTPNPVYMYPPYTFGYGKFWWPNTSSVIVVPPRNLLFQPHRGLDRDDYLHMRVPGRLNLFARGTNRDHDWRLGLPIDRNTRGLLRTEGSLGSSGANGRGAPAAAQHPIHVSNPAPHLPTAAPPRAPARVTPLPAVHPSHAPPPPPHAAPHPMAVIQHPVHASSPVPHPPAPARR